MINSRRVNFFEHAGIINDIEAVKLFHEEFKK